MPTCAALVFSLVAIGALQGTPVQAPPRPVTSVDLRKFSGTYHEIARIPRQDDECAGDVTSQFAMRTDGGLDVVERCLRLDGSIAGVRRRAKAAGATGNAMWRVRVGPAWQSPLRRAWRELWILAVGPQYAYAVIGDPARETLRILSRLPSMSPIAYQQALEIAKANGYDVQRLVRTPRRSPSSQREATAPARAAGR